MKSLNRFLVAVVLGLFFVGAAAADTLELRDGRVLKGKYLGGTQAVLRFEINGEVQTFNTTDAVALTFTGNVGRSAPAAALAPVAVPANSMAIAKRPVWRIWCAPSAPSSRAVTSGAGGGRRERITDAIEAMQTRTRPA